MLRREYPSQKELARVKDSFRIEEPLNSFHQFQAVAMFFNKEAALADPYAVLTCAGALKF